MITSSLAAAAEMFPVNDEMFPQNKSLDAMSYQFGRSASASVIDLYASDADDMSIDKYPLTAFVDNAILDV